MPLTFFCLSMTTHQSVQWLPLSWWWAQHKSKKKGSQTWLELSASKRHSGRKLPAIQQFKPVLHYAIETKSHFSLGGFLSSDHSITGIWHWSRTLGWYLLDCVNLIAALRAICYPFYIYDRCCHLSWWWYRYSLALFSLARSITLLQYVETTFASVSSFGS